MIGLAGCTADYVCNAIYIAAVHVTVVDSATGAPAAAGVKAVLKQNGVAVDSASASLDAQEMNLGGSAGTYDLILTRPGYLTWARSGISVLSKNRCRQPETVFITARIQKAP